MRTIMPLRDQVLIQQDKPKEKLASGLFVPQGSRDLYEDIGTVIAVGPGKQVSDGKYIDPEVKVGDRVLFQRRPGSALGDDFPDLLMLKEEDLLAIICDS